MNILCKICYFVIGKCDCIGVFFVAIQSKSFKNMMAIEQNKVKWTFCARFAILLLESVIALVCVFGCNSKQIIQKCDGNWTK